MVNIRNNKLLLYLLLFVLLLSTLCASSTLNLYAEEVDSISQEYSNVIDDLSKNPNFNVENYPEDKSNNSLQFVDIAESGNKELYIYVYQPNYTNSDLNATSININTNLNDSVFKNYTLTLINSSDTLFKYKVDNLVVNSNNVRLYDLSSIFRKFVEGVDEQPSGNTISEVAYPIGKKLTFIHTSTQDIIDCQDIELITITSKFVGFVRYEDGNWWKVWGESACDRHFVAFTTDKSIDKLLEADVMFSTQAYRRQHPYSPFRVDTYSYGQVNKQERTLNYSEKVEYGASNHRYVWERIQTVDDFIDSVNVGTVYEAKDFNVATESKITSDSIASLKEKQWVLSFYESAYEITRSGEADIYDSTTVSDVTILRLAFETDGEYYNLGVIDNKQTGDTEPSNAFSYFLKIPKWLKILIIVVLGALLLPAVLWVLYFAIKLIVFIIKTIIKIIKKIKASIKKNKAKQQKKEKKAVKKSKKK